MFYDNIVHVLVVYFRYGTYKNSKPYIIIIILKFLVHIMFMIVIIN